MYRFYNQDFTHSIQTLYWYTVHIHWILTQICIFIECGRQWIGINVTTRWLKTLKMLSIPGWRLWKCYQYPPACMYCTQVKTSIVFQSVVILFYISIFFKMMIHFEKRILMFIKCCLKKKHKDEGSNYSNDKFYCFWYLHL